MCGPQHKTNKKFQSSSILEGCRRNGYQIRIQRKLTHDPTCFWTLSKTVTRRHIAHEPHSLMTLVGSADIQKIYTWCAFFQGVFFGKWFVGLRGCDLWVYRFAVRNCWIQFWIFTAWVRLEIHWKLTEIVQKPFKINQKRYSTRWKWFLSFVGAKSRSGRLRGDFQTQNCKLH